MKAIYFVIIRLVTELIREIVNFNYLSVSLGRLLFGPSSRCKGVAVLSLFAAWRDKNVRSV